MANDNSRDDGRRHTGGIAYSTAKWNPAPREPHDAQAWIAYLKSSDRRCWHYAIGGLALLSLFAIGALFLMQRSDVGAIMNFTISCGNLKSNQWTAAIMMAFMTFFSFTLLFLGELFEHFELKKRLHKSALTQAGIKRNAYRMTAYLSGAMFMGGIGCMMIYAQC